MIIPVLDIKDHECVSGKSGLRDSYFLLDSVYGDSPLVITQNLKENGAKCLYVADLDKIEGYGDNSSMIAQINCILPVLLDNGVCTSDDVEVNKKICTHSILATETMEDINQAYEILKNPSNKDMILSVDIKNNELLIKNNDIKIDDIISLINDTKIKNIIILNISQVGTKKTDKTPLIKKIIDNTNTNYIIGGGISAKSITEYEKDGIDDFLIGTLLHDGTIKLEKG